MKAQPLLELRDLSVEFATRRGRARVLEQLSFSVAEGATLGIVGESGSGKSVTSLAIMGLLSDSAKVSGEVFWRGRGISALSEHEMQRLRGREMAMIFQDPMTSLNPSFSIGFQLRESITTHLNATNSKRTQLSREAVDLRACELLTQVGISDPRGRLQAYPHQFSGGMAQRVMIAMALASRPRLLIADEPTTALDVTIQAQILSLLKRLQRENGMALILVSHDLGVVAENTENLIVMYAGQAVEMGRTRDLLREPRHPYTQGLLACSPAQHGLSEFRTRLKSISGQVPDLVHRPSGCQFYARCDRHEARCLASAPVLKSLAGERAVRCVLAETEAENEARTVAGRSGARP